MKGKFIHRPHSCADEEPNEYKHPIGTIWECECGNQFKLVLSRGRVPYPWWAWITDPEDSKPKKKRCWLP